MIDASEGDQVQFTQENDPRITGIGKALRLLRIDEWPQFWNVLKGDMSLIGPRPERPTWVENFSTEIPYYNLRHAVRPGITGWAQVRQGYAAGLNQSTTKLEYDLYYVKHLGLYIDFRILIKTLSVVLRQFGAK
jgi:lipopolysaccharide/colanic/teichoic acid biosynthesis glycosyltransferase